jgi:hypothetical protein
LGSDLLEYSAALLDCSCEGGDFGGLQGSALGGFELLDCFEFLDVFVVRVLSRPVCNLAWGWAFSLGLLLSLLLSLLLGFLLRLLLGLLLSLLLNLVLGLSLALVLARISRASSGRHFDVPFELIFSLAAIDILVLLV